ncbi:MAG: hypothetical protein JWO44_1368 [Bacteroidetes bacterium]|nr:hypothetical protein [Bacteroidota bacterium]
MTLYSYKIMIVFREIIFTITFILLSASAFSQRNILHTPPLKQAGRLSFVLSSVNVPFSLSSEAQKRFPMCVESKVDYPAFFCRMELKSVDRFHIWVKFHAGDYDRYMRVIGDHR